MASTISSCAHDHCGACCSGGCSSGGCSGCGDVLTLTRGELELLADFAQTPFLPVARARGDDQPIYLETDRSPADVLGQCLSALQQKRLIRIDYDLPLSNFDYSAYRAYPVQGSMALTALGQEVLEQIEIEGITD